MTQGTVIVLGTAGRNFGAGMTGGVAFVLDLLGDFDRRINPDLIAIRRLVSGEETRFLQSLIHRHLDRTNSARAQEVLMNWTEYASMFWKIEPKPSAQFAVQSQKEEATTKVR
ncbi:MAG TPA: hypothetical protein DCP63_10135 [Bacteroidetes bacterium]|nr:hypothetical protein [Bacteroidota bacterium]